MWRHVALFQNSGRKGCKNINPMKKITMGYNSKYDKQSNSKNIINITLMHLIEKEWRKRVPRKTVTQKKQTQKPTTKYIPPHLRKVDKTQDPRRNKRKPTISLATTMGKLKPKTLKLKGIIKNINVIILIDFDSTHNYVDINFSKKLNLFIYHTR
jgi:hypothetical protein